jgi:hypothetical protein
MAVLSNLLGASPFQFGAFDAVLGALCFVIIASLVVFILVAVWVYRDAESRGMSGMLWLVLLILASLFFAFIGGLIVLVIYLIVRAEHPPRYMAAAYPGYPPPMAPPPGTAPPPPGPFAPPPAYAATAGAATCRNCGSPLSPGATFCGRCGARV